MRSAIALAVAGAAAVHAVPSPRSASGVNPNKAVVVQLFEWNWNSVAQECKAFIGPAGYGYVQVSPPHEHIPGDQWWTSYQQVSFKIQSKRGNRDEFQNMVNACKGAGVGVLVDVLFNHMAGYDSGTGVAGSSYTHYNYPGIFSSNDFHYCDRPGHDIDNYDDPAIAQNCELSNLADLKTESDYVRGRLAAYAEDLLSLGVAGFRLDAAKHIPVGDLQNILGRLSRWPIAISETVGQAPTLPPQAYDAIGDALVSMYYEDLKAAFVGGKGLGSLQNLASRYTVPSDSATVLVATHDSERWANALTYKDGAPARLAHAFMLAYPFGHTPTVLSSFEFSNNDAGAPSGGQGACGTNGGANGFVCQHRWNEAARVVPFRNALVSEDVGDWQTAGNNRLAFGRGAKGFAVFNNEDGAWSASLSTRLPDGRYCELVGGGKGINGCAGQTITVQGGKISVNVPGRSVAVVYTNAKV